MAPKLFTSISMVVFLLLLVLIQSYVTWARPHPNVKHQSAFDFLRLLKGYKKGEHVMGMHDLKKYLKEFGYINYKDDDSHAKDDDFDDFLEDAVKKYQQNFNLNPTGALDAETISKMVKPRCGVPDIINGRSRMGVNSKKHQHDNATANIHTTSHYTFFEGSPKWPKEKSNLVMIFDYSVTPEHKSAILRAFEKWASVSHFKFSETFNQSQADILIGFYKRDHQDGEPFDGPGGVLAHGFAPTDGQLHFDAEEPWAVGAVPKRVDVETVAMHEIGHLLGLQHTSVKAALMYPSIAKGKTKGLHDDDIKGIKALYNL